MRRRTSSLRDGLGESESMLGPGASVGGAGGLIISGEGAGDALCFFPFFFPLPFPLLGAGAGVVSETTGAATGAAAGGVETAGGVATTGAGAGGDCTGAATGAGGELTGAAAGGDCTGALAGGELAGADTGAATTGVVGAAAGAVTGATETGVGGAEAGALAGAGDLGLLGAAAGGVVLVLAPAGAAAGDWPVTLTTTTHKINIRNINFLSIAANVNQKKCRERLIGKEEESVLMIVARECGVKCI